MMHEGQVPIDTMLVADLLRAQFPQYADLPLQTVRSGGTENAVFRLGADLALRMPLHAGSVSSLLKEARWLRVVAPLFTLQTPSVVATGHPGSGYPFPWAIVSWLDGVDGQQSDIGGSHRAVAALAADIRSLWSSEQDVPSASALGASRGGPIEIRDNDFRVALSQCSGLTDIARVAAIWDEALAAPAWDGASVWLHTDLLPSNLLVRDGALVGVLDFGAMATGDPAYDVTPAWMVFDGPSRATYLQELSVQVGDPMWLRARGLAVSQAVIALPYYLHTNPSMVAMAQRGLSAALSE